MEGSLKAPIVRTPSEYNKFEKALLAIPRQPKHSVSHLHMIALNNEWKTSITVKPHKLLQAKEVLSSTIRIRRILENIMDTNSFRFLLKREFSASKEKHNHAHFHIYSPDIIDLATICTIKQRIEKVLKEYHQPRMLHHGYIEPHKIRDTQLYAAKTDCTRRGKKRIWNTYFPPIEYTFIGRKALKGFYTIGL